MKQLKKRRIVSIAIMAMLFLSLTTFFSLTAYANEYEENFSNYITIDMNGGSSTSMSWWVIVDRDGCGWFEGDKIQGNGAGNILLDKYLYKHTVVGYSNNGTPKVGRFYQHMDCVGSTPHIKIKAPTRNGYSLSGWETNTSYFKQGDYYYFEAGCYPSSRGEITIKALWTPNTYTVNYNANGGTGAPVVLCFVLFRTSIIQLTIT